MSATVATYEIGLDTPIHMLTPRQLFSMQADWLRENAPQMATCKETKDRWYVNSIQELATILGTSKSTVSRMKASGKLDDAISQCGRWMCIDVNKVIEIYRLSNISKKRAANPRGHRHAEA